MKNLNSLANNARITPIPGENEFRAYWVTTGRPFREMGKAWADWQAGWEAAKRREEA